MESFSYTLFVDLPTSESWWNADRIRITHSAFCPGFSHGKLGNLQLYIFHKPSGSCNNTLLHLNKSEDLETYDGICVSQWVRMLYFTPLAWGHNIQRIGNHWDWEFLFQKEKNVWKLFANLSNAALYSFTYFSH